MSPFSRMAPGAILIGILATAQLLLGCGMKGPLYRPGERTQQSGRPQDTAAGTKPPMSQRVPAPQSQKNATPAPTDASPAADPDRPASPPPGTP